MNKSPCSECPARQALFDLAERAEAIGADAHDRMRAARRIAGLHPLEETAPAGPAPGAANPDVSRLCLELDWLHDMNRTDALRAPFGLSRYRSEFLRGALAAIDAQLARDLADILPNACHRLGPGTGVRLSFLGLLRVPYMRKQKCASYIYPIGRRQIIRMKRRY